MFYTTYRPQKFSEIIKPNNVAEALSTQIISGKTSHAYLFIGPRGTGKTTTARILAKALNCPNIDSKGDPCDKCDVCLSIKQGVFTDLIEIDAASNRGIDDIRELKDKIRLAPSMGDTKVYIIDEVHMLTTEAFNALLKTLEEPPAHVTFVLCTTEDHKVPETIKSRCQVYKFKRASINQIVEKLELISSAEKLKVKKDDLKRIAKASVGGFRDAETLLQQVSEGELSVDSLLSSSSRDSFLVFTKSLIDKDCASALNLLANVYEDGADLHVWAGELLDHFRSIIFIKSGANTLISDLSDELIQDITSQASLVEISWLVSTSQIFMDAQNKIKTAFIPQLPLELAIATVCNDLDTDEPKKKAPSSGPSSPTVTTSKVTQKIVVESPKETLRIEETTVEETTTSNIEELVEVIESQSVLTEEEEILVESEDGIIDLEVVKDKWKEVVTNSKDINHSIMALLKSVEPVDIKGRFITLEVFYSFHRERLESPKNLELVESILKKVFSNPLSIKCVMGKEKPKRLKRGESGILTDFNVSVPATHEIDPDTLVGMFDGELPAVA